MASPHRTPPLPVSPTPRCWAEVDLDALRDNLSWIRHQAGPGVALMTVVKADAYGHGLQHIAAHLMRCGTDVFGVANLAEARAIRAVGRGWPVLMLGACLPDEVDDAVRDAVKVTVSSRAEAERWSEAGRRWGLTVTVHLKVDTGMGRLGAPPAAVVRLARAVRALPHLDLEGLYTHFAAAEDDGAFTARQRQRFQAVLAALERSGVVVPCVHASNSGGLLHEPDARFNLVRPGLLVYGVPPPGRRRGATALRQSLRPALSLKARVSLVRSVPRGTTVSYGHTFTARRRLRLAVVSAGYGDGYPRAGSGRAQVLIRGQRCRVIGRITMDQTMVDISRVRGVRAGDEVVLIGRQGHDEMTVTELAAACGLIPWEVLTGISYRVPRVYRGAKAA